MISMIELLRNPIHRTWLLLVLATGVTFGLRVEDFVGLAAGAATLGLAYFKGRLVILEFMELRHAPPVWRGIVEGWLVLVTVMIFAVYWMGPGT
jgi:hypothetical protein